MRIYIYLTLLSVLFLSESTKAQCSYNSSGYYTSLSAPTTIGGIASDNCIYGGEYITFTGLVVGNTYRVSTVGNTSFDTQITIFKNGIPVAYNDDAPTGTTQSEIYFTPTVTGDYDIQVNEYDCLSNSTCMDLEVELESLPVSVVTIPVVFHVIHYGEAYGVGRNISDAQIQDQINILNQDYRRMNSDFNNTPAIFAGVSADVQIEFCLAQRDPNGNSTSGIIRWLAANPTYAKSDFTAFIKPTTSWDRDSYLNFWIADITPDPPSTGVLYGFATFPDSAFPANTDGVVCHYKAIGVSPNNIPTANKGRTATHEVGHWLNLYHTFQGGCNGVGDNCFDTPHQGISTWGNLTNSNCPGSFQSAAITCSSYDMYPNYMDYTNDDCLSMFTFGQKSRTRSTLLNFRAPLLSSQGCVAPPVLGCTDPTASNYDPLATIDDGTCTYPNICGAITGVNLTDVIHDRATFNWDDMNSATCAVDQIRIRYSDDNGATYSTKTMGAPVGNNAPALNTSKRVLNLSSSTSYVYDFKIWYQDGTVVSWHAGGTFTTAAICDNVTNVTATPTSATATDFCWNSVSTYSFVRLQYREDVPGSSFSNIGGMGVMSPLVCKTKNGLTPGLNYRVMWRTWCNPAGGPYRSAQWDGPVLWTQPTSIRVEGGTAINNLDVYPNPSRDIFNVSFTSEDVQNFDVRIINVIGEVVYTENLNKFVGEYTHSFNLSEYSKGVYLLELDTDNGIVNKKLILQ